MPMYYIMISKNDIKGTNILLSQSVSTEPDPQLGHDHVRVLIDFGMATAISEKKRLRLTENAIIVLTLHQK